jgi:hypothetical protein
MGGSSEENEDRGVDIYIYYFLVYSASDWPSGGPLAALQGLLFDYR